MLIYEWVYKRLPWTLNFGSMNFYSIHGFILSLSEHLFVKNKTIIVNMRNVSLLLRHTIRGYESHVAKVHARTYRAHVQIRALLDFCQDFLSVNVNGALKAK